LLSLSRVLSRGSCTGQNSASTWEWAVQPGALSRTILAVLWLLLGLAMVAVFLSVPTEQTVLVHAARARHPPVRIPAAVLGHLLHGLAGAADLAPTTPDSYTLPAGGPGIHLLVMRILTTGDREQTPHQPGARAIRADLGSERTACDPVLDQRLVA